MIRKIVRLVSILSVGSVIASCANSAFVDTSKINKKFEPLDETEEVYVHMSNSGDPSNCEYQGKLIVETIKGQREMWTTLNNPFNLSSAEIKDRLEDVGAKIGANLY